MLSIKIIIKMTNNIIVGYIINYSRNHKCIKTFELPNPLTL